MLKVKEPGLLTTVQDLGRYGYQRFGIPPSGAMDPYSSKLANIMVDNELNCAVLEITGHGPTLEAIEPVEIGFAGGEFELKVNDEEVSMWESILLDEGDLLRIGNSKTGFRGYLSVSGGIKSAKTLKSKSTYMKGKIGGLNGQGNKIEKDDTIEPEKNPDNFSKRKIPKKYRPNIQTKEIRVILGPQKNKFSEKGIKTLLNSEYKISKDSDRMGYRLEGPKIQHKKEADIITDAIPNGAIQVPGNGKPIVLLNDRQTTGGYTKIANIITVDLPKITQRKPGEKIKFKEIDLRKAQKLYKNRQKRIQKLQKNNLTTNKQYKAKINGKNYLVTFRKKP